MIRERTVMEAWRSGVKHIVEKGDTFIDDEGRECHEVTNVSITVENVNDGKEPLHWIRSQAEWFYPTDEELKTALFSTGPESLGSYAYGPRIFSFRNKLNQIDDYIVPLLRKNPQSRRALVNLIDPISDEMNFSKNFVSLYSLWFRIIAGKLCVSAIVRSNDFLLGWAANVHQTHLLQKYIADALKMPVGALTIISLSAHYFTEDAWLIEKLLK